MYWRFFYKILSLIDPEKAHNLIIKTIKSGFLPKIKTKSIPLKVMDIKFQNPVGLAAGFDKNAETINQIHKLGVGFSEVGTITVFPQEGNPKPRIFRLPNEFETKTIKNLVTYLKDLDAKTSNEEIQSIVFKVGKEAGYKNLREWFSCLYETALGQSSGPRMGGFIKLYGINKSIKLLEDVLNGSLVK